LIVTKDVVHSAQVVEMAEIGAATIARVVAPDLQTLVVPAAVVAGMLQAVDELQDARVVSELRGCPRVAGCARLKFPQDTAGYYLAGPLAREPAELVDVVAADVGGRIGGLGVKMAIKW